MYIHLQEQELKEVTMFQKACCVHNVVKLKW